MPTRPFGRVRSSTVSERKKTGDRCETSASTRPGTGRRSARTSSPRFPPLALLSSSFLSRVTAPPPKKTSRGVGGHRPTRRVRALWRDQHHRAERCANRVPTARLVLIKLGNCGGFWRPARGHQPALAELAARLAGDIFGEMRPLVQAAVSPSISPGAHRSTLTRAAKAGASSACIPSTRSSAWARSVPIPTILPTL